VFAFDFRGHGHSGGKSTVGRDEVHDIEAAVTAAREHGFDHVATLGFSMGASVVLRHAALTGGVDAVAAVSSPARWWYRETKRMETVHWLMEHPIGRAIAPAVGVRFGDDWSQGVPQTPLELAGRIAPTPLLLVHGTQDDYFPIEQARSIHRAAPGSTLWEIAGMGHAESGMTPERVDRIADWLINAARKSSLPVQEGSVG
jgi:pimeloyl-ACP methyl ester carboxylesterase